MKFQRIFWHPFLRKLLTFTLPVRHLVHISQWIILKKNSKVNIHSNKYFGSLVSFIKIVSDFSEMSTLSSLKLKFSLKHEFIHASIFHISGIAIKLQNIPTRSVKTNTFKTHNDILIDVTFDNFRLVILGHYFRNMTTLILFES